MADALDSRERTAAPPPTSRTQQPTLLVHADLTRFTSVSCDTVLRRPLPSRTGTTRSPKAPSQRTTPSSRKVKTLQLLPRKAVKILDTRKRKGGGNSRALRSSDVDSGKEADMEDDQSLEQGEDRTIRKPQGENQRRNRGGYSVSEEVEFEPSLWEEIEKCIKNESVGKLDTTQCYSSQDAVAVKAVEVAVCSQYPALLRYERVKGYVWPVRDVIIAHLKATSCAYRTAIANQKAAAESPETLAGSSEAVDGSSKEASE